ncbi:MAG: cytochrome c biogenesis protein CcdA [Nostoc sp.]|uniref:cytochrome c biogenesis protein CcdA n=1 Tax=Nostoc sp. TaxID=1180 RepID=UPI002FF1FB06
MSKHTLGFPFLASLFSGTILLVLLTNQHENLYKFVIHFISLVETPYQKWLEQQNTTNPFVIVFLAFVGGLVASISPCILSLLPLNLSYIGTLKMISRRDALVKATLFTLGVTTVFSLFGLFVSFASAVILDFRGHTNIVVGCVILVMGLSFAGLIHLPLPQTHIFLPLNSPYSVGFTFALVSSPCGSPVLFSVLIAAANTGSQLVSIITMISYALGYSAVIFLASLSTGLLKQSHLLLNQSQWIIRLGSAALILAGGYYLFVGILWFF